MKSYVFVQRDVKRDGKNATGQTGVLFVRLGIPFSSLKTRIVLITIILWYESVYIRT